MPDRPKNDNDPAMRPSTMFTTTGLASGAAAAVTPTISLIGLGPRGIAVLIQAAAANWVAADMGFEVSDDGSFFVPLCKNDGTRVLISGISTAFTRLYIAPAEAFPLGAWPYMRLASVSTANAFTSVTQTNKTSCIVAILG